MALTLAVTAVAADVREAASSVTSEETPPVQSEAVGMAIHRRRVRRLRSASPQRSED